MKVRFIKRDITCGHNVWIRPYAKLSGCRIGDHSQVGRDVEICRNSILGNNVKIMSRSYLGSSVTIEDDTVVGSDVAITRQLPSINGIQLCIKMPCRKQSQQQSMPRSKKL